MAKSENSVSDRIESDVNASNESETNEVASSPHDTSLLILDGNPAPPDGYVGFQETSDGFQIRYARWDATNKPTKGTIILLHGRTEFIEKYFETISDLREKGFAVLTFDWRGQGGSTRHTKTPRRGYVESYEEYGRDLGSIIDNVMLPDCKPPYFVLSHSMGGLAALYNVDLLSRQISRMVLCAPFLGFKKLPLPKRILRFMFNIMVSIGLGEVFVGGGERPEERRTFEENLLTGDKKRFERNKALMIGMGDKGLGGPTVAWTRASMMAQDVVNDPEHFSAIRIPTLLISAGSDEIAFHRPTEQMAAAMRAGSLITLKGAKHELLQESDVIREQVWAAFTAYVPGSDA